jgi:hypothetical protein
MFWFSAASSFTYTSFRSLLRHLSTVCSTENNRIIDSAFGEIGFVQERCLPSERAEAVKFAVCPANGTFTLHLDGSHSPHPTLELQVIDEATFIRKTALIPATSLSVTMPCLQISSDAVGTSSAILPSLLVVLVITFVWSLARAGEGVIRIPQSSFERHEGFESDAMDLEKVSTPVLLIHGSFIFQLCTQATGKFGGSP